MPGYAERCQGVFEDDEVIEVLVSGGAIRFDGRAAGK
jgi:hypothetical protein